MSRPTYATVSVCLTLRLYAGTMFEDTVSYLSTEVNWGALLEKNEGTRAEIADTYVGNLLRWGFQARIGRLLGPPVEDGRAGNSFMAGVMSNPMTDLNLAKVAVRPSAEQRYAHRTAAR